MEKNKNCDKLLDEIIKELTIAKTRDIDSLVQLNRQTETINNITKNIEEVAYQSEVSKWQLNYIDSTFGRLYRKVCNYPIKENTISFIKLFNLKTKILGSEINQNKDFESQKVNNDSEKIDKIDSLLKDIKSISKLNNDEITKQNYMLEYNQELVDSSQTRISKNTRKIKKLLN